MAWARLAISRSRASGAWKAPRAYSLAAQEPGYHRHADGAILAAAGYPDEPAATHIFFNGERGTERFPGYGLLDLSINYNVPVFRSLRPWIKFDIYNALDNQKLIAWNTTVSQNNAGAKGQPRPGDDVQQGTNFGKATGNTQTNLTSTASTRSRVAFQRRAGRRPHVPDGAGLQVLSVRSSSSSEGRLAATARPWSS